MLLVMYQVVSDTPSVARVKDVLFEVGNGSLVGFLLDMWFLWLFLVGCFDMEPILAVL